MCVIISCSSKEGGSSIMENIAYMNELFQHRSIMFRLKSFDLSRMSVIRYLCVRLLIFTCVCPLTEKLVSLYGIMSLFYVWLHTVSSAQRSSSSFSPLQMHMWGLSNTHRCQSSWHMEMLVLPQKCTLGQ